MLDKEFNNYFIFTSQHYTKELVDIFFEEMGVRKPDLFLNVRSSNLDKLQKALYIEFSNTDAKYVIVYGDTNSTMAAARAAKKANKKIIHIEAGLRSFDKNMPEENNRVETDHLSYILFAPTELAKQRLINEGIKKNVFVVGNLVVDACKKFASAVTAKNGDYILVTAHRQENVDKPTKLMEIMKALSKLERVVFPAHPRTRKRVEEFGIKIPKNIEFIKPLSYLKFLSYLKGAKLVITDSGGVQEEAATLHVPCLTIRDTNERWESVESGGNFVIGTTPELVCSYVREILFGCLGNKMRKAKNPFGDGKASIKIIRILKRLLH